MMRTKSLFHNSIHLKILPTLIEVFLRHIIYCQTKAFYENEYDKINELWNFKWNLASHINKIRDGAIELGSRDLFQDLEFRL